MDSHNHSHDDSHSHVWYAQSIIYCFILIYSLLQEPLPPNPPHKAPSNDQSSDPRVWCNAASIPRHFPPWVSRSQTPHGRRCHRVPQSASTTSTPVSSSHGRSKCRLVTTLLILSATRSTRIRRHLPHRRRKCGVTWVMLRPCRCPWPSRSPSSKRVNVTSLPFARWTSTVALDRSAHPRSGMIRNKFGWKRLLI